MQSEKPVRLQIKLQFSDQGEAPSLQAYAFTAQGKLLGSAVVEKGGAVVEVPAELDGRMLEVILGPRVDKGQPTPTATALKRMDGYAKPTRLLVGKPVLELNIPSVIFPRWCSCFVRGRLRRELVATDHAEEQRRCVRDGDRRLQEILRRFRHGALRGGRCPS
ncbi:MAG TPA: hypothetical protein VFE77_17960 [Rhodanobacter sp.]|nr:hypothetical protein [Rhodanobacter sp.]